MRQRLFLNAYAECGNINRSCMAVGIDRGRHYVGLARSPVYAQAFTRAREDSVEELEAEAWRRARHGTSKPVYQMGMLVGYIQEYSDTLMVTLLKGHAPDKYKERVEQSGTLRVGPVVDLSKLTDVELDQWATLAAKVAASPPPALPA